MLNIFVFSGLAAQQTYQFGLLPAVNINARLASDWSFNYKIESRQLLIRGAVDSKREMNYDYILTDQSLVAAKKVGLNSRVALGYLIRIRDQRLVHRSIQQFALTQRLPRYKLSHRWVCDQTYIRDASTEWRLRYRLAMELPLNGNSTDVREYYIKASNEYLNTLVDDLYELELRAVVNLGYRIRQDQRLEMGLDYRVGDLASPDPRHSFWTSVSWFLSLGEG